MTVNLPLRERRRVQIRRDLAAAAIELFAAQGAAATTVDDIVAAAGCSASTFFRSFATKEDAAFFDAPDVLESLTTTAAAAGNTDVWNIVRAGLVRGGVDFAESGVELMRTRLRLFHTDPPIAARYAEICAQREAVIAALFLDELAGRPDAELEAWLRAGAIIAATRAALRTVACHGGDLAHELDRAIRHMERGFPDARGRAEPGDPTPP